MIDHFARLNEARRPWLDPEALKGKFFQLSSIVHPDRVHHLSEMERAAAQERYVELNAAYNCLREPRERIRHLLQLELGTVPGDIKNIPADLMDLFMKVGQQCQRADALLIEKSKSTSALLQVQFFERSHEQADELSNLRRLLSEKRETLVKRLKDMNANWDAVMEAPDARAATFKQLEEMLHLFGFYDRWISQIQERISRLSF